MNDSLDDSILLGWMRAHLTDPDCIDDDALRIRVEAALADPAMRRRMEEDAAFDDRFRDSLREHHAPQGLLTRILIEHGAESGPGAAPAAERGRWFHFGAFGMTAAALIIVAVSFTFFRPLQNPASAAGGDEFFVEELVNSIELAVQSPIDARRIGRLSEAHTFLAHHGHTNPAAPPPSLRNEQSFSCRVLESKGMKIAMICFQTEDGVVHLISFPARDVPNRGMLTGPGGRPVLRSVGEHSVASWVNDDEVHMLLSRMDLAKLASRL